MDATALLQEAMTENLQEVATDQLTSLLPAIHSSLADDLKVQLMGMPRDAPTAEDSLVDSPGDEILQDESDREREGGGSSRGGVRGLGGARSALAGASGACSSAEK